MTAQPIHEAFPGDPAEILRILPPRWHAQFLDVYRVALEAARGGIARSLDHRGVPGGGPVDIEFADDTASGNCLVDDLADVPGEIVDVEIDLSPVGLGFYPGEQLRLAVSAQNAGTDDAGGARLHPSEQRTACYPHR